MAARRMQSGLAEILPAPHILNEPERHPDTRGSEPVVPVDLLPQITANDGGDQGAQIYAHIEDGESGITAGIGLGVERSPPRADIRFEKSRSEDDEHEALEEKPVAVKRHAEMAEGDDNAAEENRLSLPEKPVGNPSAGEACHVDHRRVHSVDRAGGRNVKLQTALRRIRSHVEDEESAHAIVTEPFPHLGGKERRESPGMAEKCFFARRDPGGSPAFVTHGLNSSRCTSIVA